MAVTVLVASLSFIGIGLMAAIFPLLSPEKGPGGKRNPRIGYLVDFRGLL